MRLCFPLLGKIINDNIANEQIIVKTAKMYKVNIIIEYNHPSNFVRAFHKYIWIFVSYFDHLGDYSYKDNKLLLKVFWSNVDVSPPISS